MSWLSRHTRTTCNSNLVSSFRAPHLSLVIVLFYRVRHAKCVYFVRASTKMCCCLCPIKCSQCWKVGNKFRIYQELYVLGCRLTCFPLALSFDSISSSEPSAMRMNVKCWWCDEMSTFGMKEKVLPFHFVASSWILGEREGNLCSYMLSSCRRHRGLRYVCNFTSKIKP